MKIKTQDYNEVTVVQLQGDLDGEFTEPLRNTVTDIIAAKRAGVVFDMSDVGFVDSQGLEQLLWTRDYCNENNCQLRLAGIDETVAKIMEVTQLENEFDHYSELSEAVKSFT